MKDRFCTKKTYPRFVDAEVEDYADIIRKFTKPQEWLGHISGNHPLVLCETNIDPVQRLCSMLGHPYLGYSAFVPILFTYNGQNYSLMLMCHHGFGGNSARMEGSSYNSYINHSLRYAGWDCALYGHRHDKWTKTISIIEPQSGIKGSLTWVKAREKLVVQCGTYLRTLAYSEYPTYSEKQGYPPKPIGSVNLKFKLTRFRDDRTRNLRLEYLGSNC